MNTLEILQSARTRLEKAWCAGARGKTAAGYTCSACDPNAVLWCALGALDVLSINYKQYESVVQILDACVPPTHCNWVDHYIRVAQYSNLGKDKALKMFDHAITSLPYINCMKGLVSSLSS